MRRDCRLIRETVEQLELDLSGLVVLTEAATGHYAVTAAIAAAAEAAAVFAIAKDSRWGSSEEAAAETRSMVRACVDRDNVTTVTEVSADILGDADVVTNLGFVRPLNEENVSRLKATAAISLMCEPWEVRPSDVDIGACFRRGIVVLGTNENSPSWPVFSYSGPLALHMLSEAGLDVSGLRIAVLGRDRFAPVIAEALRHAGAFVQVDQRLEHATMSEAVRGAEAVVVADYASDDVIIGPRGLFTTSDLVRFAPDASIIQFAGGLDEDDLRGRGFRVWPSPVVQPRRMSRTFAALGPKPVIELHAAGLRVGEAATRLRLQGIPSANVIEAVCRTLPIALPAMNEASMAAGS